MDDFIPLGRVGKGGLEAVGGKAAALGELIRIGLPVPRGFVIRSRVAGIPDPQTEQRFIEELVAAFDLLNSPRVAVRSSATNEDGKNTSWAGQLNTFLYVSRGELLERIRACWGSAYGPRALAYAQQHNVKPGGVAVIVQAMIPSAASGVAFSVHPVTKNRNHMIIEAGLGLGEAIVSGHITPDTYVVHKTSGAIVERHIADQSRQYVGSSKRGLTWQSVDSAAGASQKLADQHIAALAGHIRTIEMHFGHPVDVEWAFAGGKLYITQARPITTL